MKGKRFHDNESAESVESVLKQENWLVRGEVIADSQLVLETKIYLKDFQLVLNKG